MGETRLISLLLEGDKKNISTELHNLLFKCIRNETTRISATCRSFFKTNYEILLAVVIKDVGAGFEEWKVSGLQKDTKDKKNPFKLLTKKSEKMVSPHMKIFLKHFKNFIFSFPSILI
jgi:hypothetical protein